MRAKKLPELVFKKTLEDIIEVGYDNPAEFARWMLDVDPYPAQEKYLLNSRDVVESNLTGGNRIGKSLITGVMLLWKAFYSHGSSFLTPPQKSSHVTYTAVNTSITIDQAKLAFGYAERFAKGAPQFKQFLDGEIKYSPFPVMRLKTVKPNGKMGTSEIWARSLARGGLYLLGHSLSMVSVDECAYIPGYKKIEDEVIKMRLADQGGSLYRHSTPNGKGQFFDYYNTGAICTDGRYYSQTISTWENPFIPREFLKEQQVKMLPEFYAQNVLGEFVSLSDFFKFDSITALYKDQDYTLPVPFNKDSIYVAGVDLGRVTDPTVIFVLDISSSPSKLVYFNIIKNADWKTIRSTICLMHSTYKPLKTLVDATGQGGPIVEALIEEDGLSGVEGYTFTTNSKLQALTILQDEVQQRGFVFPYTPDTRELISELSFYRIDDKRLVQDCVIAAALGCLAASEYKKMQNEPRTNIPTELIYADSSSDEYEDFGGTLYTMDRTGTVSEEFRRMLGL